MTDADFQSPRSGYEHRQRAWLAPWAIAEANSGPRAHSEEPHPYRTCFQRDRDRIVHCSAFRRLDFKTQVFVPHEHDHYRTRLTHTLEVAQVGRDLARALRLNEDLVEAVALAHDLGHPPFGHAGEAALGDLMRDHGQFEHNRQSLRVVDYLEHPYPDFRGLNLTRVVRECLAKHETRYDTPICEEFDTAGNAPLEGQLVDLADEIAYTSADLEDSLAAGWISREQLAGLELWNMAWSRARAGSPGARAIHTQIRACKTVLAILADDLAAAAAANIRSMNIAGPDDVRDAPAKAVAFSEPIRRALGSMQEWLLANVYTKGENAAKEQVSRRIINSLFEAFVDRPELLPTRYARRIDREGLHRVVCDYIAGMTDRFCLREHERLIGPVR